MKIFVIGPEGAGKTVFLAMLSHHMANASSEVVFAPVDYDSTRYVASALDLLECQKWPKSNPQGEIRVLRWRFGRKGKSPHEINLFDYSGQDMRSVLLEDDSEKLQGRSKELRQEIDDSDMLIYLIDMDGFIGGGVLTEANENAWLLHTFLTRPMWRGKRRILVVTKADVYAGMISEAGDLEKMIEHHWPKIYNADEFLRQRGKIKCFALTSVMVTTELDDGGRPVRIPLTPLQSEGFDALIEGILSGIERDWWKRVVTGASKARNKTFSVIGAVYRGCTKYRKVTLLTLLGLGCLGYFSWILTTEPYEFTFVTGGLDGAGTDSNVKVELRDSSGSNRIISFGGWFAPCRWKDPFENGQRDVFSARFRGLSSIKELTVEIKDSGENPAWFISRIFIRNVSTGETAHFFGHTWLGKDTKNPGDDPWKRTLVAQSEESVIRQLTGAQMMDFRIKF